MQTKTVSAIANMAEATIKFRYTAEELLKYSENSAPCADFVSSPQLDLRFEENENVICPTTRWFYSCKWKGNFNDLKQHLLEKHEMLRLKQNNIIVTKGMFFVINRGFIISDDLGENYYLINVTYYVDKTLYVNVISLKNRFEARLYRVTTMGRYHIGEVGGTYVKIAGIREFFNETEDIALAVFFEFL